MNVRMDLNEYKDKFEWIFKIWIEGILLKRLNWADAYNDWIAYRYLKTELKEYGNDWLEWI